MQAGKSGARNYNGKAFKYFQEIQFLIDKISNNFTKRNVPRMTSKSAAIPIICSALTLL